MFADGQRRDRKRKKKKKRKDERVDFLTDMECSMYDARGAISRRGGSPYSVNIFFIKYHFQAENIIIESGIIFPRKFRTDNKSGDFPVVPRDPLPRAKK